MVSISNLLYIFVLNKVGKKVKYGKQGNDVFELENFSLAEKSDIKKIQNFIN